MMLILENYYQLKKDIRNKVNMAINYSKLSDKELINIIGANPNTIDASKANIELDFRKYKTIKLHNWLIVILTAVIAITSVINIL